MEYTQKVRDGWHHFTDHDRDRMELLLSREEKQKDIAIVLGVHPSTISREKKRQRKDGRYDADTADHKARVKRSRSKYQGMKRDNEPFYASKNAIYHWLYSVWGERYCHLLCTKRKRRKRQKKNVIRTMISNRKSIDLRPLGATNKTRYGHYEGDTIVAPKRAMNTESVAVVVERKTKLLRGTKIPSLAPRHMTAAMERFSEKTSFLSVTMDNGIENRDHERWSIRAYFADAHSPWQKPMIENVIGLLRRWFFKKGTDWALVSEGELQYAIHVLNHKYRKSLNYQSAMEVAIAHGMMKQTKTPQRGDCN